MSLRRYETSKGDERRSPSLWSGAEDAAAGGGCRRRAKAPSTKPGRPMNGGLSLSACTVHRRMSEEGFSVVVFGGQKRQNIEAARRTRMRSRSRLRVSRPAEMNSRRTEAITNEVSCYRRAMSWNRRSAAWQRPSHRPDNRDRAPAAMASRHSNMASQGDGYQARAQSWVFDSKDRGCGRYNMASRR